MVQVVTLKTKGMFDDQKDDVKDYELWRSIAEYMNEERALVASSSFEDQKCSFIGLLDCEKNKELCYMMEQDSLVGTYINDRKGFDDAWDYDQYFPDGSFYIEKKYIEFD